MVKGIDVSKHNGSIDWGKVKAYGTDFAILRAGFGRELSQKDTKFEDNYKGAKGENIPLGAYWYSYADSTDDAKREAQVCLKAIEGKKFEYPIFFDLEEKKQFDKGKAFCDGLVRAFCGELEKAGYFAGLYCSTYWLTNFISKEVSDRYALWVAQYGSKCTYMTSPYGLWQHSSTGKVSGISGNVDLDYCYKDYPGIIKDKGLNGYGREKEKTVDEIAKEVIRGKWGNGEERKKKLTEAGYDYATVQKRVNELL